MINVIGIKNSSVPIENEIENEEIYKILTDEESNYSGEEYTSKDDPEDEYSSEDSR